MPHRASVPVRLAVLVAAAAGHDVLAKLLYSRGLPAGMPDVGPGAQILYTGGTVVEVGIAAALMAQWYARTGRALRRADRWGRTHAPG
jgi:putative membrane protein